VAAVSGPYGGSLQCPNGKNQVALIKKNLFYLILQKNCGFSKSTL
jgi:hypothetical protein